MKDCLVVLLTAFALTVLLTPVALKLLRHYGFWNAMDAEHEKRMIRGGGIALAAAFFLCGYGLCQWAGICAFTKLNWFAPAATILLLTGLLDDRFGLKAKPKLLLQTITIGIVWFSGYRIHSFFGLELPWYISLGATWLWSVAILNGFNLIDGLDGLCTGNALIFAMATTCLGVWSGNLSVVLFSLMLAGCCAGFLLYNVHPAKLFLGDTGSLFLGLVCTFLSLSLTEGEFTFNNTAALLLLFWVPFCDLGLAVWRRKVKSLLKGSHAGVMNRDQHHLHHRVLQATRNHSLTVVLMWTIMLGADIVALLIFRQQFVPFTLVAVGTVGLVMLLTLGQYELRYSQCLLKHLPRCMATRRRSEVPAGAALETINLRQRPVRTFAGIKEFSIVEQHRSNAINQEVLK